MKKIFITICAAVLFTACADQTNKESTTEETTTPEAVETTNTPGLKAEIDPICDMVKDSTWTEYSVSGADTVWFCSETCKSSYDANPAKYQQKG